MNICNIFNKKAHLYLDESLAHTFDDLLGNNLYYLFLIIIKDKGYNIVNIKKDERDLLKESEEAMKGEIHNLERDILPLFNQK